MLRVLASRLLRPVGLLSTLVFAAAAALAVLSFATPQDASEKASAWDRLPLEAKGLVARTLARDDPAFHARSIGGGFAMKNADHGLTAHFARDGLSVRSGHGELGMALEGYGRGASMHAVPAAAPRASANRVSYRRGEMTEWYANGALGVEQGFTLRAPPRSGGKGALALGFSLSGDLTAKLERNRTDATLADADGRPVLAYRGLIAADARGRKLPAWLELHGRELRLRVDDRGARYPLTVDPFVQQARIVASDGAARDEFGNAVAVSGDTVVVGSQFDDIGSNGSQGSAYVFEKPAGGWASGTETAKLTASDGAQDDRFGSSVAVSGDTVVVGSHQGSAYVFEKPGGGWVSGTEAAELTAFNGAASDLFGLSVAVSGDTVVVGSPFDDIGSNGDQGSAYVFEKLGGGWVSGTETAKLTASDGAPLDQFGLSVAVSDDTVVVGSKFDDIGSNGDQGSAYVFETSAGGWASGTETAKVTASDGAPFDQFGYSVAVSDHTVVVGSPFDDIGSNSFQGSAYVVEKSAGGWASGAETAKLTASDGAAGDWFGHSVAVSDDTVVVSAPLHDETFSTPLGGLTHEDQGDAYVFAATAPPPSASIDSGSSGPTNSASPAFAFSSSDTSATFECKLDGPGAATGTYEACSSPKTYSGLADGGYTFSVRAISGGNAGEAATRSFMVDSTAPDTSITSGPTGLTATSDPSFEFTSTESASSFECKLDGPGATSGSYASCSSPHAYSDLADGEYTLSARATDAAANTDDSEATRSFTVDATAPDTSITSGPTGLTGSRDPSFEFTATESGGSFECKLDGPGATSGSYASCSSPRAYSDLADGAYTLSVRATDGVGNSDESAATRSFAVDATAPETTIGSGPSGATNDATPAFAFSSSEAGSGFECRVDEGEFASCDSPHTTAQLGDGEHTFAVRAIDAAGNADGSEATRSFTVDTTPPQTTIDSGPSGATNDATPAFAFSSSEAGSSYECRVDEGDFASCDSPHTTAALSPGGHSFAVRAIDAQANADPTPATRTFTVESPRAETPIPPAAPGPGVSPPAKQALEPGACANAKSGTRARATLLGTGMGDLLRGLERADRLVGLAGDDCLFGRAGRDRLAGGQGNDRLAGGSDNDRLAGGAGNDRINPGTGNDRIAAGAGNDRVLARGTARDTVDCGPGRADVAIVDRRDRTRRCERVRRR